MTDPEPTPAAPAAPAKRPRGVVVAVVIVVVIALAGGAFVVYKLTDKKDPGVPAYAVAKTVLVAVQNGNKAVIVSNSTGDATSQLEAFTSGEFDGLTLTKCSPFAGIKPTRVCEYTRPGGQLTLRLVRTDNRWKVDAALLTPTAVTPPTGAATTTTT